MPTGPVTQTKAWIEMIHRYLATGVGALILSLALFHLWLQLQPDSGVKASWWPWLSLVWVCVQGAFGALTVTMKLFPLIVTLHLLGGLALLALLTVQARLAAPRAPNAGAYVPDALPRVWLAGALLVLFAQAALGAWVSTNYAVLACNTIPMCQGQWWPAMDFAAGFALWRELGHTAQGAILPFVALTAIHMVHRLFAVAAFVVLGLLIHRLFAVGRKRTAQWLLVLTGMQLLTGLSNVILGWPLLAALLHTGGAGAMTMVLTSELAVEGVA
jgi:cytochrome c oxidase assembly protein subunit 15